MTRFPVYGRDLPDGHPLEVAWIEGGRCDWRVRVGPVNDPTRTWISDSTPLTRRGAIRVARRWLRSGYADTTRLYVRRRP